MTALALACSLFPALPRGAAADAPVPLDYKAYDGWNTIANPVMSDDGTHLAYALTPQDGDPTLVVRDLDTQAERREARGSAPAFAASGRFVVFTRPPVKKELDAARKAKKTEAQLPKGGIGIPDLSAAGAAESIENVKSVAVPGGGGSTIAYRAEATPAPSASPAARPSVRPSGPPTGEPAPQIAGAVPAVSASPSPSVSPSASPSPKADKTKETGSPLTIRDLVSGKRATIADVTEYAVSYDGRFVAYAVQTKKGDTDGVSVYDTAGGTTAKVLGGDGRYRKLALARDGSSLAFLSDVASYAEDVPHDALYVTDLRKAPFKAAKAVDTGTPGLGPHTTPNANGAVTIARDASRVYFGTAAAPTPAPSGTPEPMKVDVWTYEDDVLQSAQRHDADRERKRTYLATYDLAKGTMLQLGSPSLRDVQTNRNTAVVLGSDERPYRRASSWLGEQYVDVYAISLRDGAKRKLAVRNSGAALSPGGAYALAWDERTKHWYSIRTSDGRRTELAAAAGVPFHDISDDHPAPAQPYGFGGWIEGDRAVLLYDEFDVWKADPDTGKAVNLTHGLGRRTRTVYSPVQTDRDAEAFSATKPMLLSLLDTTRWAYGYARIEPAGGLPATLVKRDERLNPLPTGLSPLLHDRIAAPFVAKNAPNRWLITRSTVRQYPDAWITDPSFSAMTRVTDANPQQSKYRWATERLISYKTRDGKPLRAVMLIPDGMRAEKKAPMLVYFYERWSDTFHSYYRPAPGTSPNFIRYASNGYVVLFPDVAYRPGHPGPSAYDSLMPAVDAALATGYVNPQRIGIAGHSWAAYQINYLITRTNRFRAVEAGAAVDNMTSAYSGIRLESGNVREGQYEHGQSRIGATPWERPDLYLENSGLFHIKNISTPYLTIHNDQDGAVPFFQGIEFVTAMRRLGKPAYMFSFDGEDHNLRGREQQKFWTVHLDEWFDHYLKGAPRPAWFDGVDYLHRGERNVHPLYGEPD